MGCKKWSKVDVEQFKTGTVSLTDVAAVDSIQRWKKLKAEMYVYEERSHLKSMKKTKKQKQK